MSLETSAIFCLPLVFKVDPGSDVNYNPGFRWLLFQPAHFLGLLLSVSAVPKASVVHSPAGSSMALGTRDGSQPLAHYLHYVGSAIAATCSFVASRCWNQVVKGSQKARGSWWESIGSPEETARSVSCNPVLTSLSSPRLTALPRSLAASSGQTDSLTSRPQHSMQWRFT